MDEWIEVVLIVPTTVAETAGFVLAELGSAGVTLENRELDTFVAPDPEEMVSETLAVRAYFPQPADSAALLSAIQQRMLELAPAFPGWTPQAPSFTVVRNEDWAEGWKQHFPTTRISRRLVVRPSWEAFTAGPDDVVIEIDPGMAFGTGTHGTTRLCLEAVAAAFESEMPPRRVLDVGTGSGILAIAAAAYGAEEIVACDIDADACAIAFENAILNQVDEKISFTIAPLEELEGSFDLVLANILAEENIRLADALLARLAPGGRLVLSGILIEKEEMVINAFKAYGLGSPEISHNEDWSCLLYRRP
ncbi:MAG: 50S ribosomal protein L11 methyltransferase [Deltaproteobacteria bacterium HGW-Deltaproteobacteria-4]|nr:MAG: 50S ribosomal protein L11 methyltransferase [Deltaproteobacteria bacterium HGW-Deltaproteobacteria-4]